MSGEVDVLAVGCPLCGASSHEPCWSDVFAHERLHPHGARIRFAHSIAQAQPARHHTVADTLAAEDRVRAEDGHIGGRL